MVHACRESLVFSWSNRLGPVVSKSHPPHFFQGFCACTRMDENPLDTLEIPNCHLALENQPGSCASKPARAWVVEVLLRNDTGTRAATLRVGGFSGAARGFRRLRWLGVVVAAALRLLIDQGIRVHCSASSINAFVESRLNFRAGRSIGATKLGEHATPRGTS